MDVTQQSDLRINYYLLIETPINMDKSVARSMGEIRPIFRSLPWRSEDRPSDCTNTDIAQHGAIAWLQVRHLAHEDVLFVKFYQLPSNWNKHIFYALNEILEILTTDE